MDFIAYLHYYRLRSKKFLRKLRNILKSVKIQKYIFTGMQRGESN